MTFSDSEFLELVPRGQMRAVSALISLAENQPERAQQILSRLLKSPSAGCVVGVTGAPGVGKSTLVGCLAGLIKDRGAKVGVVAVDPSSPFSGGAVLGDRIRMPQLAGCADVFVRSMASRGAVGGLARGVIDALQVLRVAGFDYILLETVGAGQAEVEVMRVADTCLVLVMPGMGDAIQAFKAGILEIADIFVVNKADREGAAAAERDLNLLISLGTYKGDQWQPRLCRTVATSGEGCQEVLREIEQHQVWLSSSEAGRARRVRIMEEVLFKVSLETLSRTVLKQNGKNLNDLARRCLDGKIDLYSAAARLAGGLAPG